MLISHVGNVRVETPEEFAAAIAGKDDDVGLRVVGGQGKLDTITVGTTATP